MALTHSRGLLLLLLLGPETMAGSLGVPVLTIGIKRFTNQASLVLIGCAASQLNESVDEQLSKAYHRFGEPAAVTCRSSWCIYY